MQLESQEIKYYSGGYDFGNILTDYIMSIYVLIC